MLIETIGKPYHISMTMVKNAVRYYGENLLGNKLHPYVTVQIKFKKFEKGTNDYAYCDWVDDNHCSREFCITIDSRLNKKETLLALAHEMVHVKQYAKGEMKEIYRPTRMVKWQGKKFLHEEFDYWEQPWEIEAYGREKGLYVKFVSSLE